MPNFSAVLVGINKYKDAPLNGCVNDVVIMRDILVKKYGIPADQIRLILDERATKENIVERLEWLVESDAEQKMFHYSGHGAQIPVRHYNSNEVDGMNELLCPYDFDWRGTYILDDEINQILGKLPDSHHMTMVFDCCHSGTITRSARINIPRQIKTPLDILSRDGDLALTDLLDVNFDKEFFFSTEKRPVVTPKFAQHNISVITGCKDNQTSADAYFGNRYQGALSYVMQGLLIKEPHISLKELRRRAEHQLKRYGFTQTPQLFCNEDNLNKPFIQV